ncbi:MAG: NAD-dependent epimerase/dehydratase family protein [Pirellulales bacterium]|nr:NAD-dependent epimerase/dehydratase family protein [Pirellulales bacterium]
MKVAVSGGAGFIGSHTCEALLQQGHHVVAIDNLVTGRRENLQGVIGDVQWLDRDITAQDFVAGVPHDVDAIIHLAFPTPKCDRAPHNQFHSTAAIGTANVLDWALACDAKLIYGSSISVYGIARQLPISEDHPVQPMLVYGANKLHGEFLCQTYRAMYGLNYDIVRISDVFGPRDQRRNAINNFIAACLNEGEIRINGGHQRRSYTFVRDVAAALSQVALAPASNDVFNLSAPDALSINEVVDLLAELSRGRPHVVRSEQDDPRDYVISSEKFRQAFPAVPFTDVTSALAQTLQSHSPTRSGGQDSCGVC